MGIETCNEALTIQPKSVKAVCRRGLAKEQQGKLVEALTDVKQANEISADDKTVKADLERIKKVCKDKGISDADIKAAEQAGAKAAKSTPEVSDTSAGKDYHYRGALSIKEEGN